MKTGKTPARQFNRNTHKERAAMEPDHEDREDRIASANADDPVIGPQWSPIMKTGKTTASTPSTWRS